MWQFTRDPKTKRLYNAQISYVRSLLKEHRQSEWDAFAGTLNFRDKSLYKLNRRLLGKRVADTPLQTKTGHKIYDADEKSELFADTREGQFLENPGDKLEEEDECIAEITRDHK